MFLLVTYWDSLADIKCQNWYIYQIIVLAEAYTQKIYVFSQKLKTLWKHL